MQSLTHFVAGAAICRHVRWRPAGLALALVSHFALDALPHFEDPSILPPAIAPFVGRIWYGLLWGLAVVFLLVVAVVWRHFSAARTPCRQEAGGPRVAAYLIIGGLLAVLPDVLTQLLGERSLFGRLNSLAHLPWFPFYHRVIMQHREWRPVVVLVCLATEALVLGLGAWWLLRSQPRVERSSNARPVV